ncbi:MAG: hypothetical protein U0556_17485 [Dehalococcoidia bacterium]
MGEQALAWLLAAGLALLIPLLVNGNKTDTEPVEVPVEDEARRR